MSNNFRLGQLQEIIDFKNGKSIEKENGKIPIYGGNGILGFTQNAIYENVVIIGRVGAYCGSVHIESGKCWVSDNAIAGLPKNDNNIFYIYYLLKSISLNKQQVGSSQPLLTQGILNNLSVKIFFDLLEQKKIAAVLSALDNKIELNNRINTELENLAKTIYDYWFVQFDFPDKNGKPYKASGGKMVYNQELKRSIPKGWEVNNIEKYCQIVDCLHSKKSDLEFEAENYFLLQLENIKDDGLIDLTTKYYVTKSEYEKWTSRIEVIEDDILITNAGRVAATAQIPKGLVSGIGRNITAIRPLSISPTYLFLCFRGIDLYRQIKLNTDSGAFFTSLNVRGIKKLLIVKPPNLIESNFEKIVYSLRRKRELNNQENQQLTQLRDWLLPMLMNGQVTVK